VVKDFELNIDREYFDFVVIIPHSSPNTKFYADARAFARKKNAKLVLLNFESPNWFNKYAASKKDPSIWDEWLKCTETECIVLSLANESQTYARDFYTASPDTTKFEYWYPAINSRVADAVSVPKEDRILAISRLVDKHKGSDDILESISEAMSGYTLVLLIGTQNVSEDYLKQLDAKCKQYNVKYEIKYKLTDAEKFAEIKRARLMLFPSYFEGYGYPPVESQYCGTPCVVYDLPVLRETSKYGLYYAEHGNIEAFKSLVKRALNDKDVNYGKLHEDIKWIADFDQSAIMIEEILLKHSVDNRSNNKVSNREGAGTPQRVKGRSLVGWIRSKFALPKPSDIKLSKIFYNDHVLKISGWVYCNTTISDIRVVIDERVILNAEFGLARPDVLKSFPELNHEALGFEIDDFKFSAKAKRLTIVVEASDNRQITESFHIKDLVESSQPFPSKAHPNKKVSAAMTKRAEAETWREFSAPGYRENSGDKIVVVTTHIQLIPAVQGNRVYTLQLIETLRNAGYKVFLVSQVSYASVDHTVSEYLDVVDKLFICNPSAKNSKARRSSIDRAHSMTEECVLEIVRKYNVYSVVAQYVHMAFTLEKLPHNVLKVLYTHDVLHRLEEKFKPLGIEVEANRTCTPEQEKQLLELADVVVAITDVEKKILKNMVPDKEVIEIGMAATNIPEMSASSSSSGGHNVLYTASNNPLNARGLEDFLSNCWPTIRHAVPQAKLSVIGEVKNGLKPAYLNCENVDYLGRIDDLTAEFDKANVVINCTTFGTGLAIKTVEAIARGKAVVATEDGAEGILYNGKDSPILVGRDWGEFANHVISLLTDTRKRNELERLAVKYRNERLSEKAIFGDLLEKISSHRSKMGVNVLSIDIPKSPLIKPYIDMLMETVHRLKLSGRLGVLLTDDQVFTRYVAEFLKTHGLNFIGVYTLGKMRVNGGDFVIKPIAEAKEDQIDLLFIPSSNKQQVKELDEKLYGYGIRTFNFLAIPSFEDRMKMLRYKNKHLGETAFILGNGPSVRVEDLEMLDGKLVFAANRFHLAYANMKMRPSYTAVADMLMTEEFGPQIAESCETPLFVQARGAKHVFLSSDREIIEYDIVPRPRGPYPQVAFSHDLTEGLGNGASIIYDLLQIAVWMGVKRIYLYGIDHNFIMPANYSGKAGTAVQNTTEENHFLKNYRGRSGVWYSPVTEIIEKGFSVAREYCESNGIEIYNVTRGGKLEIYERRDFDDIVRK